MTINKKICFGPAGNSTSFNQKGYKYSYQVPEYLSEYSLNAFEYQCGRGVRINRDSAEKLKKASERYGIIISLHAPYYISLASKDEEKRENSINYIVQSAKAVKSLGGNRIIVHPGGLGGRTREEATLIAVDTLKKSIKALDENNLSEIIVCPETMGKINQLGNLDEIIEFCKIDERFIPCIDFGHLNARTLGGIKSLDDYEMIFSKIENGIGVARTKYFHSHFSKIEFTTNGGEKRHLTFEDKTFGPDYEPLLELTHKKNYKPTFICESDGTQAEDAKTMMDYYNNL